MPRSGYIQVNNKPEQLLLPDITICYQNGLAANSHFGQNAADFPKLFERRHGRHLSVPILFRSS